ncbi:MAG: hypothetical protein NDF55_05605 [archaeon GB-1867-005]|nr:hypothetical protein [Candidatus Culexmicrobium cathedralense]
MIRNSKRKGISPVIAVLLLIVIAVAASVITYSWITWFLTVQQQQAASMIRIEEVDLSELHSNEPKIKIYVRNIGTVKVTIDAVYINATIHLLTSEVTINPGELEEITVPISGSNLKSGHAITIKVATKAGTFATYKVIVP